MTGAAADGRQRSLHPEAIEATLLKLAEARGPAKSFCPSEAARRLAGAEEWRGLMAPVREAAARLAAEGRLRVMQAGAPADPLTARGPLRFAAALPRADDDDDDDAPAR